MPKRITITPAANALFSRADKVIGYFPHHAPALMRKGYLNTKQIGAQIYKSSPLAGGIQTKLPNSIGRLIFRSNIFGPRRAMRMMRIEQTNPIGKARIRGW